MRLVLVLLLTGLVIYGKILPEVEYIFMNQWPNIAFTV